MFYLIHYPSKDDEVYVGPNTYFLSMKTQELQNFKPEINQSLNVFGI